MSERDRIELGGSPESGAGDGGAAAGGTRKKGLWIGVAAVLVGGGVLAAGVMLAMRPSAPDLPRSAEEALEVMRSDAYDLLSEERKRQYAAEAARLMRDMDAESRRALFEDQSARDAMREMGRQMMTDMAYQIARGGEVSWPFMRRGGDGERRRPPRGERPEMSPEEEARRREAMNERMTSMMSGGNAQANALMGEMFQSMRREREGR